MIPRFHRAVSDKTALPKTGWGGPAKRWPTSQARKATPPRPLSLLRPP